MLARFFGITALGTAVLSVLFNLATYIPALKVSTRQAWPLPLVSIAVCVAMLFSAAAQRRREPKQPANGLFAKLRARFERRYDSERKMMDAVPDWVGIACMAAILFAVINFGVAVMLTDGGSPVAANGRYYLEYRGVHVHDITQYEYQRYQANEVRGLTGHCLVFSMIPAAYFLVVYPKLRETTEPPTGTTD